MKMLVKSLFWYTLCLIAVLHVYSNSVIITMQQSKSTYIIANFIELTKNVQWVLLMAIIPTDFKKTMLYIHISMKHWNELLLIHWSVHLIVELLNPRYCQ